MFIFLIYSLVLCVETLQTVWNHEICTNYITFYHKMLGGQKILCPPCPKVGGTCLLRPPFKLGTCLSVLSTSVVPKLFRIAYRLWVPCCQHVPLCSRKSQCAKYNSRESTGWHKKKTVISKNRITSKILCRLTQNFKVLDDPPAFLPWDRSYCCCDCCLQIRDSLGVVAIHPVLKVSPHIKIWGVQVRWVRRPLRVTPAVDQSVRETLL